MKTKNTEMACFDTITGENGECPFYPGRPTPSTKKQALPSFPSKRRDGPYNSRTRARAPFTRQITWTRPEEPCCSPCCPSSPPQGQRSRWSALPLIAVGSTGERPRESSGDEDGSGEREGGTRWRELHGPVACAAKRWLVVLRKIETRFRSAPSGSETPTILTHACQIPNWTCPAHSIFSTSMCPVTLLAFLSVHRSATREHRRVTSTRTL